MNHAGRNPTPLSYVLSFMHFVQSVLNFMHFVQSVLSFMHFVQRTRDKSSYKQDVG
jgi:hypothetical protein